MTSPPTTKPSIIVDSAPHEVEATREGLRLWREAVALRGSAEHDVGTALTRRELASLNQLRKKMTLYMEKHRSEEP